MHRDDADQYPGPGLLLRNALHSRCSSWNWHRPATAALTRSPSRRSQFAAYAFTMPTQLNVVGFLKSGNHTHLDDPTFMQVVSSGQPLQWPTTRPLPIL
eukprot:76445-Chlamydomonas_euryale.AAC.5